MQRRKTAISQSTTLSREDKGKAMGAMVVGLMSSEESCGEAGSSDESGSELGGTIRNRLKLITRPLTWRSAEASNLMMSLERKFQRRQTEKARRMMADRTDGPPSERSKPDNIPEWTVDFWDQ